VGAALVLMVFVSESRESRGDTSTPPTQSNTDLSLAPSYHDPSAPYSLGPHPISYDQLSSNERVGVDQILEAEALDQPPSSVAAWADAAAATGNDAQAQIAARTAGLVGTDQDGVTP
jgi:hypothetical protein